MNSTAQFPNNDEVTFKSLLQRILSTINFLAQHWLKILLAVILGAGIGYFLTARKPEKFVARLTFVLEETKSSVGGLASLAGQFGVDLGSSGGGGIFNGDNILLFLKSESLVKETLLSPYPNAQQSLADRYVSAYNYDKAWKANPKLGHFSFFKKGGESLNRVEDSLLQGLVAGIIKNELSVSRPDKKASFLEVKTSMRDEILSKLFCERLVDVALNKYVTSKVKVKAGNVNNLQRRADSLESLLNARTYTVASTQQSLLDLNPGLRMPAAQTEITNRNKLTAAAIYTEVVKNLELAKTILNQETPTIEIVDTSSLPLKKEKESKLFGMIIWASLFAGLVIAFLLARRWWTNNDSFTTG